MFDRISGSTSRLSVLIVVIGVLTAGWLPEISAYTSALVHTASTGNFQVVAAQPAGSKAPFVYCTAGNVTVAHGTNTTITITCTNGFAHSVPLSVTYSATTSPHPPSYSPSSPLSLTVPANGQASTSITVTNPKTTDRTTFTLSYTAATSGSQGVTISGISFSSTLTVT
jgi:hypothetical protein